MRRRELITLIGAAAAWPLAVRAQQPDRVRRIGVLMGYGETDREGQAFVAAFREGLQKLGWVENRNRFRFYGTGTRGRGYRACPLRRPEGRRQMVQLKRATIGRAASVRTS